jgi:hypothetical protein
MKKSATLELEQWLRNVRAQLDKPRREESTETGALDNFIRNASLAFDGSYGAPFDSMTGTEYRDLMLKRLAETCGKAKKLQSLAIQNAQYMLTMDFPDITISTITKTVAEVMGRDLEKLNRILVEDLKQEARDQGIDWKKLCK